MPMFSLPSHLVIVCLRWKNKILLINSQLLVLMLDHLLENNVRSADAEVGEGNCWTASSTGDLSVDVVPSTGEKRHGTKSSALRHCLNLDQVASWPLTDCPPHYPPSLHNARLFWDVVKEEKYLICAGHLFKSHSFQVGFSNLKYPQIFQEGTLDKLRKYKQTKERVKHEAWNSELQHRLFTDRNQKHVPRDRYY